MNKSILLFISLLLMSSCNAHSRNPYSNAEPASIYRFDKALFQLIENDNAQARTNIRNTYPMMLDIFGKGVLNMQTPDRPGFFDRLVSYFSETTLKGLYRDALTTYENVSDIEQELGSGFAYLKDNLPSILVPAIYMHVSGLNQNILVGENTLSISIDKYLGEDYAFYQNYFYPYQRTKMQRSYVVRDYLAGWLMSEFPFEGNEAVLLEKMVYEGKILYLLSEALPEKDPEVLIGISKEGYQWCQQYEGAIWTAMIERKHLYTPNNITTGNYFEEIPSAFLSDEAPGYLGRWIGWQIVKQYMKESGITVEELMKQKDAQKILSQSKYKPI